MLNAQQEQQLREKRVRLANLYPLVKKLIIKAENKDQDFRLSMPAINELRNAFDHTMRVSVVLDLNDDTGPKKAKLSTFQYCLTNLDKAIGHTYRAGYDAFDIIALHLTNSINLYTSAYSLSTLYTVFRQYDVEIKQKLDMALNLFEEAKLEKDVESIDAQYITYEKYDNAISSLIEIEIALREKQSALQEYEDEENKKERVSSDRYKKQRNIAYFAIIFSLLLWLLAQFL